MAFHLHCTHDCNICIASTLQVLLLLRKSPTQTQETNKAHAQLVGPLQLRPRPAPTWVPGVRRRPSTLAVPQTLTGES